jgi:hypothetical protein
VARRGLEREKPLEQVDPCVLGVLGVLVSRLELRRFGRFGRFEQLGRRRQGAHRGLEGFGKRCLGPFSGTAMKAIGGHAPVAHHHRDTLGRQRRRFNGAASPRGAVGLDRGRGPIAGERQAHRNAADRTCLPGLPGLTARKLGQPEPDHGAHDRGGLVDLGHGL